MDGRINFLILMDIHMSIIKKLFLGLFLTLSIMPLLAFSTILNILVTNNTNLPLSLGSWNAHGSTFNPALPTMIKPKSSSILRVILIPDSNYPWSMATGEFSFSYNAVNDGSFSLNVVSAHDTPGMIGKIIQASSPWDSNLSFPDSQILLPSNISQFRVVINPKN